MNAMGKQNRFRGIRGVVSTISIFVIPAVAVVSVWSGPALATDDAQETGEASESEAPSQEGAAESKAPAREGSAVPQINIPRFELPTTKLPEVELEVTTTKREELPERAQPRSVGFSVESIDHARSHRATARGCVARGRLEGFRIAEFPTQVQPFSSCIRFSAERPVIARLEARILDPGGREVADATGEVSFAGGGKTIDYVIAWAGFPARDAGTYEIVVSLERTEVGRFPLEVSAQ